MASISITCRIMAAVATAALALLPHPSHAVTACNVQDTTIIVRGDSIAAADSAHTRHGFVARLIEYFAKSDKPVHLKVAVEADGKTVSSHTPKAGKVELYVNPLDVVLFEEIQ